MGKRENKVESYLADQVKQLGGISRKWVSPGRDGVTDQICIYKGAVYFVEVKTVDGKLSPAQKREHQRLIDVGANVTTVYGREDVDNFIYKIGCKIVGMDLATGSDESVECRYPTDDSFIGFHPTNFK